MDNNQSVSLRRGLGFWALVVYGVGDILGAGIYALVGKIAGVAGTSSWLAFVVALGAASLTALSYSELGSRFPKSGGEAQFCQQAFRWPGLSLLIGWLVLCSGLVSVAAVSHAFAGYLLGLFAGTHLVARYLIIAVFLLVLAGVNFWGIRQSSLFNIVCTCVETGGLLLVIVVGTLFLLDGNDVSSQTAEVVDTTGGGWGIVLQGAALAFFAFIGFEDMVNVAEEVESPRRTLPVAILIALLVAGSIYIVVVSIATSVVGSARLAESDAPLLEVVRQAAPAFPEWMFTLIALFAVANTGLLNSIMGSRLLYGMANQRLLPSALSRVHARTQTPHWAIVVLLIAAIVLAFSGTLVYLAGTTSVLLLIVFSTVNASLVVVKWRQPQAQDAFRIPLAIPILGGLTSLILIGFLPLKSLWTAAGIFLAGLVLVVVQQMRSPDATE